VFLALAYVAVCTFLLTLPGSAIPKDNWSDRLWIDKWVHFGMFFIMVVLWCVVISRKKGPSSKWFVIIAVASVLYGIAMEIVQHYWIPHRSSDPGDMIADAAGSIAGLIFSSRRYIKK
jgi:VanZ family protein